MYENHMSQKTVWLVLVAALVFACAIEVTAAVPQLINYQGRLTNSIGAPLDTTVNLVFTIYKDSLGTGNLWSETHPGVVIQDGLFQVLLGSVKTLEQSVFEGSKLWLGVQLQGGPAPMALIPIVSVAYAYRSAKSDTAGFAVSGGSNGWINAPGIVRLKTDTDNVGIGNSNPVYKLDVSGEIRASSDLRAKWLTLGSPHVSTGGIDIYHRFSGSQIVKLAGNIGNGSGELRLSDTLGNQTHILSANSTPAGGGNLILYRDTLYMGFTVFHFNNEPEVTLHGSSRSAIFDMSTSGDASVSLPTSSINNTETLNEAGLSNSRRTSSTIVLANTIATILTRHSYYPSGGWVLAIATANLAFTHIQGTTDYFNFAISGTPGVIPTDQNFNFSLSANLPSVVRHKCLDIY